MSEGRNKTLIIDYSSPSPDTTKPKPASKQPKIFTFSERHIYQSKRIKSFPFPSNARPIPNVPKVTLPDHVVKVLKKAKEKASSPINNIKTTLETMDCEQTITNNENHQPQSKAILNKQVSKKTEEYYGSECGGEYESCVAVTDKFLTKKNFHSFITFFNKCGLKSSNNNAMEYNSLVEVERSHARK